MRTAIIADIHANLEGLQAVLERIHALGADRIVCLGDIVGYNADPNECVDLIRNEKVVSILGNHDAIAAGMAEPDNFNPIARKAALWTRNTLTAESRQFLRALPRESMVDNFFMFHGSIHDTGRYILHRNDMVENFRLLSGLSGAITTGFFGHTHQAVALIEQQGKISTSLSHDAQELMPGSRYLINPGSVGQPRDGDPQAAFAIHDPDDSLVSFHRVAYDIDACQKKILRAGLPTKLAERLERGQ
jgi:diadenosine tetraphosphatase ApaH/serine/threonine PP2A family protein phosphatase